VLFGGTFDPIHLGHTAVAAAAVEQIGGEKVVFVPAKCSPLKHTAPEADDQDRLQMTGLAIEQNDRFELSDYELRKARPSYTLETVRHFKGEYADETSIYWLIGADALDDLPHWYRVGELLDECNLAAMFRGGCEPPDFSRFEPLWGRERVENLERNIIRTPLVDISSTEIRRRLAGGGDVTGMVCPAVADYIYERGLYRAKAKS